MKIRELILCGWDTSLKGSEIEFHQNDAIFPHFESISVCARHFGGQDKYFWQFVANNGTSDGMIKVYGTFFSSNNSYFSIPWLFLFIILLGPLIGVRMGLLDNETINSENLTQDLFKIGISLLHFISFSLFLFFNL